MNMGLSSFKNIIITGMIFSGNKESVNYLSFDWVKKQLVEKIGFVPFPGTLNVKLDEKNVKAKESLMSKPGITIDPQLGYYSGKCYHACIRNNCNCVIIIPESPEYPKDVLEVISPMSLRSYFQLKDGDCIQIEAWGKVDSMK
jgi:riboflavin kinase